MSYKFELQGVPALLPVVDVIELLAHQDAACEAAAAGEPPVRGQDQHSLDVRIVVAERKWSSAIAQALLEKAPEKKLVIRDCKGLVAPRLGIVYGFFKVAAVAQWLANAGASVELDGVQVVETLPAPVAPATPVVVAAPVVRMKKEALVKKHSERWPTVESDLKEASRQGHWLGPARLADRGYYDESVAVDLATRQGRYENEPMPGVKRTFYSPK